MTSIGKKLMMTTAALVAGGVLYAAPASAQATRTWVSGVGDDVNPCSRTAPCRTFAGAISKTAAGGEINCLDPMATGTVTITKAMSLICDDLVNGTLASGTTGITVNAGDADVVTLSGLNINGVGTGINGINFVSGGGLVVRNTTIQSFGTQGINFTTGVGKTSMLSLTNVAIQQNGTVGNATTGGVKITVGNNGVANVTINKTRIGNNNNVGLRVDTTGTTGGTVNLSLRNTEIATSGLGVQLKAPAGASTINAMLDKSVLTQGNIGLNANGSSVFAAASDLTITGNTTGITVINGATVNTFGDNNVAQNGTNGAFTTPVTPKQ